MAHTPASGADPDPTGDRATPEDVDEAQLRRIRRVAHLMDDAFRIPGTDIRVGIDPILGVLPGVGDGVAALFSLYIVLEAVAAGVPRTTLLKMLAVVVVDVVVGSVPVLGPLFDAAWKANTWNVKTLERHLGGAPDRSGRPPRGPPV